MFEGKHLKICKHIKKHISLCFNSLHMTLLLTLSIFAFFLSILFIFNALAWMFYK